MLTIFIDDDPIQRLVVRNQINRHFGSSITVLDFENGNKALQYFSSIYNGAAIPKIVFIDIHMPAMNGWQLLDNLLPGFSSFNDVDFYMWSCSEYLDDHKKIKQYPFLKGFLIKPIEFSQLFRILDDCLQKQLTNPSITNNNNYKA